MSSSYSSPSALPEFAPVQLGQLARPAQLVRNGFPSDANKPCTSAQLLLRDPESIQIIAGIESELERKAPAGHVLHSTIIREVEDGDVTYPVIRCKFTRNSANFSCDDSWGDSPARSLAELEYGHEVLGMFRPVAWKRDNKVGVVFYCNRIRCGGRAAVPIGGYELEEVEWK